MEIYEKFTYTDIHVQKLYSVYDICTHCSWVWLTVNSPYHNYNVKSYKIIHTSCLWYCLRYTVVQTDCQSYNCIRHIQDKPNGEYSRGNEQDISQ